MPANDLERARTDAFYDGVILALQVLNAGGDCGNANYDELVNCCGLDALTKRARAEGMMRISGLDKYRRIEKFNAAMKEAANGD